MSFPNDGKANGIVKHELGSSRAVTARGDDHGQGVMVRAAAG
jgi:hypothetical protein